MGDLLDHVLVVHAQVAQAHHALVVDGRVADLREHVPFLERVVGGVALGLVDDDAFHGFIQLQERSQRRVFQRLVVVEHGGFAVVFAVGDVREEKLDLLGGNDVADVLRAARELAEGEADHLVADDRRTAAVAGVDGAIDLDAQPLRGSVVRHELDARNDALGDGQTRTPFRVTVDHDGILDVGQVLGQRERGVRVEEGGVVELEHGEVDAGRDGFDGGADLVARLVGLHLDLARVEHDVRVGEDAVTGDDRAAAGEILRGLFGPGAIGIGITRGGEDFDDAVLDGGVGLRRGRGFGGRRREHGADAGVGVAPTPRASAAVAGVAAAAGVAEGDGAAGALGSTGAAGAAGSWARVAESPAGQRRIAAVAARIRERWDMVGKIMPKRGACLWNLFSGRTTPTRIPPAT